MEDLIKDLKNYKTQNLTLQETDVKIYKERGLALSTIIKKLNAKTLPELIEVLEAKSPGKQYEKAIDSFVKDIDQQIKNTAKI
jgi:hypothetical protein